MLSYSAVLVIASSIFLHSVTADCAWGSNCAPSGDIIECSLGYYAYLLPGCAYITNCFPCPFGFSNPEYNQYTSCTPIDLTPIDPEFPLVISNCPAGDYLKDNQCLPCRYGSSSAAGAGCPANQYSCEIGSCSVCPAGQGNPAGNKLPGCTNCGPNTSACTITSDGTITITACASSYTLSNGQCLLLPSTCPASQFIDTSGFCAGCPPNQSTPAQNSLRSCTSCGQNVLYCTISGDGSITITQCVQSYTLSNGQCLLLPSSCPASQFIDSSGQCSQCPPNQSTPDNNSLRSCTSCGSHVASCSISAGGKITNIKCDADYTLTKGKCLLTPTTCPANRFISSPGNCSLLRMSSDGNRWKPIEFC